MLDKDKPSLKDAFAKETVAPRILIYDIERTPGQARLWDQKTRYPHQSMDETATNHLHRGAMVRTEENHVCRRMGIRRSTLPSQNDVGMV